MAERLLDQLLPEDQAVKRHRCSEVKQETAESPGVLRVKRSYHYTDPSSLRSGWSGRAVLHAAGASPPFE